MSLALLPAYNAYKQRHPDEAFRDLVLPLLVHAGIWSAAGAAGGLAFGLGLGERSPLLRTVLGGLVGAAVGAMAYELIGASAFPAARTAQFVSETWETRLLARLAVTVLAAVGTVLGLISPRNRPRFPPLEGCRRRLVGGVERQVPVDSDGEFHPSSIVSLPRGLTRREAASRDLRIFEYTRDVVLIAVGSLRSRRGRSP